MREKIRVFLRAVVSLIIIVPFWLFFVPLFLLIDYLDGDGYWCTEDLIDSHLSWLFLGLNNSKDK